jgi:hypothetical protein
MYDVTDGGVKLIRRSRLERRRPVSFLRCDAHVRSAEGDNNAMATQSGNTRGGSSEQHAEAGRQSHKNEDQKGGGTGAGTRGGSSAQHAEAGRQSHKNDDEKGGGSGGGTRGGSSEQHAKAGRESHKND